MVNKNQNEEQRQMALQIRDTRVFAFMDQLEKAEKFPVEVRSGVVSMLNEKIKYMMDWETAEMISSSELVPKDYIGKPNNVFLAIQTGRSLGLDPFQSVKHLYTVNGRTSIFGDMMLALAKDHKEFDDCIEIFGELTDGGKDHGRLPSYATCTVKRKDGKSDVVKTYTLEDAMKNPNYSRRGYQNSPGIWMVNGKRMMQMRARSFALRDAFPDKLSGVYDEYEIQEIAETKDITSQTTDLRKPGTDGLKDSLKEDIIPETVESQDDNSDITQDKVNKEQSKPEEKPENIEQIKSDFLKWAKDKIVSKNEYKDFADAGGSGLWSEVVKMHENFSKKASAEPKEKPLGKFAKKLSKIVDNKDYTESIENLISDKDVDLIDSDNAGDILRTKDEALAKDVYMLIESRKDMIDSAKKDAEGEGY